MTDFISFKSLKRPPKPNTCLAAPENHCLAAEPDFAPPVMAMTGRGLFSRMSEVIASERRFGDFEADPENLRIKFVATTGLMRFKDDVDIEIIPVNEGKATFAIYSRSRVGYSDLGANRKRVKELIRSVNTY
ncbi:MAG: DUF1499 domain-containing protein [Hyphomonadaceae bacterium]|nr:DUF1499 domain-containing protein [Hyphomonadaceae bacterium]